MHEITKLVKYSPRRGCLFDEFKDDIAPGTPGIRVLYVQYKMDSVCWLHDGHSLEYTVPNELWDKAYNVVGNIETIASIWGAATQMDSFLSFFGLILEEILLRHTNNQSRTLQQDHVSAAEGQAVATMTIPTLASLRNDESSDLLVLGEGQN